MRKLNFKLLTVLSLLVAMLLLVACNNKNTPTETQGQTENKPAPTESVTEGAPTPTDTPTDAPIEAPTDAPVATEDIDVTTPLSEEEVKALLQKADQLYDQMTARKEITEMGVVMADEDMGTTTTTRIVDGTKYLFSEESNGVSFTAIILDDKAYIAESYGDDTAYALIALNAQQREYTLAMTGLMDNTSGMTSADLLTGISGVKHADGTVILTATGLSDAFLEASGLGSDLIAEGVSVHMTLNSFEMMISPLGLPMAMQMNVQAIISAEQDGVSMEMAVDMEVSGTMEYNDIEVTAPENASAYTEVPFDIYFGITPDSEAAEIGGLPLDESSYTIGGENNPASPDDQFSLLASYPAAYEGKSFVIYGTVSESEEFGVSVINAGEYGVFFFYCPSGVSAPVFGDSVKITATFENTVDKGYDSDYPCYTMMVSACEVLARGVGPNGGRIMFITASSLNVRTSSDTSSSDNILGTLSHGDAVEVFEQDEKGWWRIEFNGQTAYISNKYVSETRP